MEYDLITAKDIDSLVKVVNEKLKTGWRLKSEVVEHIDGYAQAIIRHPMDCVAKTAQARTTKKRQWITI